MCATPNIIALNKIHQLTKPITAWKIVTVNAHSIFTLFQYQPGWNQLEEINSPWDFHPIRHYSQYSQHTPFGFHAFIHKPSPARRPYYDQTEEYTRTVTVTIHPKDVFVAEDEEDKYDPENEKYYKNNPQLVASKIYINQKQWEQAGISFPQNSNITG